MSGRRQKETVQAVFTRAADGYTALKEGADRESHQILLRAASLAPGERCLDIGAGPGFATCMAAGEGRLVVGLDLTPAFLAKARARITAQSAAGVTLVAADVEGMPFGDGVFDVVVSHKALHHFVDQAVALREARRVLRRGGRIAIADSASSEDPAEAALHNHIERVRDPSHVEMLSVSRLEALLEAEGFDGVRADRYEDERDVDWWLDVIDPSPAMRLEVLRLLRDSMARGDASGMRIREDDGGRLWFTRKEVVATARRA